MRRRQILENPARERHAQMRVDVREARHHHPVAPIHPVGIRETRAQRIIGADRRDAPALDGDGGAVMHRVGIIDGDDGGVVDQDGHGGPP